MEQAFLKDVLRRLEGTGLPYAVTGSIASSIWGIPRTTHDVDIVIVLSLADTDRVVAAFADDYYVSEAAVRQAIATAPPMFNVLDTSSGLKADFWLAKDDPFNQSMLRRRKRLELIPGQECCVGTAEDVLLHKLVWHMLTPSERQLADAAGIVSVQAGHLDVPYMRHWATLQSTTALLDEVLSGKHLKTT